MQFRERAGCVYQRLAVVAGKPLAARTATGDSALPAFWPFNTVRPKRVDLVTADWTAEAAMMMDRRRSGAYKTRQLLDRAGKLTRSLNQRKANQQCME